MTAPLAARRSLVTGAAGFIGSHLVERLLAMGDRVTAVDAFTPYYDPAVKQANTAGWRHHPMASAVWADLRHDPVEPLLADADLVFHLAGEPGVRRSWAENFVTHEENNIRITQRLLDAAARYPIQRFVYASSSSVYGNLTSCAATEDSPTRPHSPYGVTKLAAEHLCRVYADNFGVPTVCLRYFTVYGPRQRPDMALHRLVNAALTGAPFPRYGSGEQVRDFTYVDDAVAATVAAGRAVLPPGIVFNVAGGGTASLRELIALVTRTSGRPIEVRELDRQKGDVERTGACVDRATTLLNWRPATTLDDGVRRQVDWHLARLAPV
jgi:nucleoside-diphosphate-sugar epimerase